MKGKSKGNKEEGKSVEKGGRERKVIVVDNTER